MNHLYTEKADIYLAFRLQVNRPRLSTYTSLSPFRPHV